MKVNDPAVDVAMNSAVLYLEESNLPVTPESQRQVLSTWELTLAEIGDPDFLEIQTALGLAVYRLDKFLRRLNPRPVTLSSR